jgi:hypothetical protein
MCACALNKKALPRAAATVFRPEDMGTAVLMAEALGCLSPGTYSEAGPKFQGWRPRLPPKETNELSSRDRPGSRRAVVVGSECHSGTLPLLHCAAIISSTILSFLRSETLRRISRNCFVSASIDARQGGGD